MSREDVRRALEAIDSEEVRDHVAAGDLSGLGPLSLDPAEVQLVREAAHDFPEVEGFQFSTLGIQPTPIRLSPATAYGRAVAYAKGGVTGIVHPGDVG